MKILKLFLAAAAAVVSFTAQAEYVDGQLTWVAEARSTVGVVHTDYANPSIRRWTTNGTTYVCNTESRDPANFRVVIWCPTINYRIEMQRNQILVASNGGVAKYPGSWDDRRSWDYRSGDIDGKFVLRDGLNWEEVQYRRRAIVARFNFRETFRDATYIYMFDASRNVHFSLTRTGGWLLGPGDAAYRKLYDGAW